VNSARKEEQTLSKRTTSK